MSHLKNHLMNGSAKTCWVVDLGLVCYAPACELQRQLVEARKAGAIPDVLLLCEHPHVITLGRNGKREHLRASESVLAQMSVEFQPTDRGGDITYHGPGQSSAIRFWIWRNIAATFAGTLRSSKK